MADVLLSNPGSETLAIRELARRVLAYPNAATLVFRSALARHKVEHPDRVHSIEAIIHVYSDMFTPEMKEQFKIAQTKNDIDYYVQQAQFGESTLAGYFNTDSSDFTADLDSYEEEQ